MRSSLASSTVLALLSGSVLLGPLPGCSRTEEPRREAPTSTQAVARKLEWRRAPPGDGASVVREAAADAAARGRRLVVYVGATWCEPCQRFHHAAAAGELDSAFGDVTFLEFDADVDEARLRQAGYTSEYIPLFVLPDARGHATEARISGSIKGSGAVADITPRLARLLGR